VTETTEWHVLQLYGPAGDGEPDLDPGPRWRDEASYGSFRDPEVRAEALRIYREDPDARQARFVRRTETVEEG
jgi:hypothetical protein